MDKQGRVTKWSEWRMGAFYNEKKGRRQANYLLQLVEINRETGSVVFKFNSKDFIKTFTWRNRYVYHHRT